MSDPNPPQAKPAEKQPVVLQVHDAVLGATSAIHQEEKKDG